LFRDEPKRSLKELLNLSIDELRAKAWAVNFLVPDKDFIELIFASMLSNQELSKHFKVTEEFIELKWQILQGNRSLK